jgi:TM2 domain-containing membrane protein YozV
MEKNTHSLTIGYILWIFGFTGSHRFYFGRPISGTIYFCTMGLFGIGWLFDLFIMESLERSAERKYKEGKYDYTVAWILLTFLGFFGVHRFYLGKWWTGLLYLLTGGLLTIGYYYDFLKLNEQVSAANSAPV